MTSVTGRSRLGHGWRRRQRIDISCRATDQSAVAHPGSDTKPPGSHVKPPAGAETTKSGASRPCELWPRQISRLDSAFNADDMHIPQMCMILVALGFSSSSLNPSPTRGVCLAGAETTPSAHPPVRRTACTETEPAGHGPAGSDMEGDADDVARSVPILQSQSRRV